jgi:hypothetical protein
MSIDPHDPGTLARFPDAPAKVPNKEPKVYVVQETSLNLIKATKFGELITLLPGRLNITTSPAPVIRELKQKLKNFCDHDYLLPNGDPLAIGLTFTIAMEINRGKFRALKWDNVAKAYYVVSCDIYERRGGN